MGGVPATRLSITQFAHRQIVQSCTGKNAITLHYYTYAARTPLPAVHVSLVFAGVRFSVRASAFDGPISRLFGITIRTKGLVARQFVIPPYKPGRLLPPAQNSTTRRLLTLSSAASTIRRLLIASCMWSDRSRSSRMARSKKACSRVQSASWSGSSSEGKS